MTETSAPFEAAPVVAEPEVAPAVAEPEVEAAVEPEVESIAAEAEVPADHEVELAAEPEAFAEPVAEVDDVEDGDQVEKADDEVGTDEAADVEADAAAEDEEPAEAEEAAEAQEADEDPVERRVAEVSALLDDAAGCETADVAKAAALYQEAIVGCLEAAGDPLASAGVRNELLRGFDGLSSLLERQGLADESLAVVDDAAALGLLNGGEVDRTESRDALRERREGLRRALFADSAQL